MASSKQVKICAVTTVSHAMEWFVADIMRTLAAHDYAVTLICRMDKDFAERNADFAECINLPMSRGVSVHDLLTVPLKLRRICKEQGFDVLYYMNPNAAFYASLGGMLAGVPTRIYSQAGIRYVSLTGVGRTVCRLIEKMTCAFSTHIRAVSPRNRQYAIDEGLCRAEKIAVTGIGGTTGVLLAQCDAFDRTAVRRRMRETYGVPADAFVYGYVGRINVDKGIGELIEAFGRIRDARENVWLLLMGMTDVANPVPADLLARARADARVIFTGEIPTDAVYRHMAMLDCLTHPTHREGFGKVLQEAMGMRLPIITTDIPGASEVVEAGVSGILVPPRDADALAEAMKRMADDRALRESLAAAGRARAERYFDRPIMLRGHLEAIEGIVRGGKTVRNQGGAS